MTAPAPPLHTQGLSATAEGRPVPSVARRFAPLLGSDRVRSWVATLSVTAMAGFLRFHNLGRPHAFLFDETYYAKDGWSLINNGYVREYYKNGDKPLINDQILQGNLHGLWKPTPSFIVHPEAGKWLIGIGEKLFGMDPEGWRVASALAGTLMVLVMIRLVRRLTGSTLLGCVAGVLLCFDGLQFVMSRLALLDIFVATFMLCAVSCLVADRDWARARLAKFATPGTWPSPDDWGPRLGFRPWRLAAGLLFGVALACKWNALPVIAAFGLWTFFQDAGARRALGVRKPHLRAFVRDSLPALAYLVLLPLVVYVASWTGWLIHAHQYETYLADNSYGPYWGDYTKHRPHGLFEHLFQPLRSLWNFHVDVYKFHHSGLNDATHPYQSTPQGWPLLNRPVGVDVQLDIKPGQQGCDAAQGSTCLRQIILLGTPALWWGGAVALVYSVWAWLVRRDWRFGIAVIGFVATWLPWVSNDTRPIFYYYAVAMIPFTVIGTTLCLGKILGGADASPTRRATGTALAGAFVVLVVVNFAWFYPVYTDGLLTNSEWLGRIWLRRWI